MTGGHLSLEYRISLPMTLDGGGAGVPLVCDVTASVGQLIAVTPGKTILVGNDGSFAFWFLLGPANVRATLGSMLVLPGDQVAFTVADDGGVYTHISTITRSGTTTGTANWGTGS